MLKKLLKHEWKATWRNLALLNGGILLLGVLGSIMLPLIENSRLMQLSAFAALFYICSLFYFLAIFAVAIATNLLLISRFYRNMFTDEGYLMHTLPVTPAAHIFSKLLVYLAWFVIDCVSIFASVSILFSKDVPFGKFFTVFWEGCQAAGETMSIPSLIFALYVAVMFLLVMGCAVLSVYFSASVGNLFNSHKKLGGILCFAGINMAVQFLLLFSLVAFNWNSLVSETVVEKLGNGTVTYVTHVNAWPILLALFLLYLFLDILFFLGTQHILAKRLNLE